ALSGVGVVRLGVDAVIPVRRGRWGRWLRPGHLGLRLDDDRWRVGVGRVRRREPEGIPEEGIDPEAECRPYESEVAEETEPGEALDPLPSAADPATVDLAPAEPAAPEPGPTTAVEAAASAAVEAAPRAAVEPSGVPTAAVEPAATA